jgi:hypothetical protein
MVKVFPKEQSTDQYPAWRALAIMILASHILKIKRAESPLYRQLNRGGRFLLTLKLPIPRALDRVYSLIRFLQILNFEVEERICVACYRFPVLRSMCVSVGKNLRMEQIPDLTGTVRIYLGDDVRLSGRFSLSSGRVSRTLNSGSEIEASLVWVAGFL